MPTPPKTIVGLDELIAGIQTEWDTWTSIDDAAFGPYLRRRLAEHGVQDGRHHLGGVFTLICAYYTEISNG